MNDINSLAHSKWNCKYHIVFCTQVSEKSILRSKKIRDRSNSTRIVQMERCKYRSREFWCKGYYVDTVGKNKERIAEYIRTQLEEDRTME